MTRFALAFCLMLLPVAAVAGPPDEGALGPMNIPKGATVAEPMSRSQIAQLVADHGYFEMDGLRHQGDGSWTCTAMAGPGRRVALTIRNGAISERTLPQ